MKSSMGQYLVGEVWRYWEIFFLVSVAVLVQNQAETPVMQNQHIVVVVGKYKLIICLW